MLSDKFWQEGISLYIDAAAFQHKYNPHDEAHSIRTMAWRLKNEGIHAHCTAKVSHVPPNKNKPRFNRDKPSKLISKLLIFNRG